MLFVALVISLAIKEWIDAGVIAVLIAVNILVGFMQEYRAERTLAKLRQLSAPTATVVRDGRVQEIDTAQIVPGDVVYLTAGDRVPADVRLYDVSELETDEALLTGESASVEKRNELGEAAAATPLAERANCAFMGTSCVRGAAKGVVVNTGQRTELGRIAESLSKSKKETTLLQKRLDRLGQVVVAAAVVCCVLVLLTGWAWGTFDNVWNDGLVTAVSTAVAIIPESLLPVLTLALTLGVRRLARHNAIIRRLGAIESLGNITHVCSDKTGTLTLGRMSAAQLRLEGGLRLLFSGNEAGNDPTDARLADASGAPPPTDSATLQRALQVLSLCTVATLERNEQGKWIGTGSPTEVAILVGAHAAGAPPSSFNAEQVRLLPFDSSLKRMSVAIRTPSDATPVLLLKGAPEQVLQTCTQLPDGTPLTDERRRAVHNEKERVAGEGLRVLGLAWRPLAAGEADAPREQLEAQLTWLGLVALADPPRASVPGAVRACQNAGIAVFMATGDQAATARAIAQAVGILPPNPDAAMVSTAADFDSRPDDEDTSAPLPLVIARCTPQSKVRLIKQLHRRKGYVAMTGDGVNDAPALAGADVGVAMSNASDVAKEAADMVLTEDDFSVIVRAIEEGRRIFANIRKFIILYLAGNVAEVVVLVFGICFGLPPPLLPIQILCVKALIDVTPTNVGHSWVNLITGTPPAMALACQPFRPEYMDKRVRPPGEGLWNAETLIDIGVYGILAGCADLGAFVLLRYVRTDSHLSSFSAP